MNEHAEITYYQIEKYIQKLNIPLLRQKNIAATIFYSWNPSSDTFRASSMFKSLFGINPCCFADIKQLIFKDDLARLEQKVIDNSEGNNTILPLRLRTKSRDFVWFLTCFGWVAGNIISGTLDPVNFDKFKQSKEIIGIQYERMQFALKAARAGLWDWDAANKKVYFAPQCTSMMSYKPDNFGPLLSEWFDRVHPDDLDQALLTQLHCLETPVAGHHFTCTFRFRTPTGNYRWIRSQGVIVCRDAQGKALRVAGLYFDVTEEHEAKKQLESMAICDTLTGLNNSYYFKQKFTQFEDEGLPAAYILVHADGLKMVNTSLSPAVGDMMLLKLADTLRSCLPGPNILARISGDEFAIFLPQTEEPEALKILETIHDKIGINDTIITCASIGLAYAATMEELITLPLRANVAMIAKKRKQEAENLKRIKTWIESSGVLKK